MVLEFAGVPTFDGSCGSLDATLPKCTRVQATGQVKPCPQAGACLLEATVDGAATWLLHTPCNSTGATVGAVDDACTPTGGEAQPGGGEEASATGTDCEGLAAPRLRADAAASAAPCSLLPAARLPHGLSLPPAAVAVPACYAQAAGIVLGADCNGLAAISELTSDGACCTALKSLGDACLTGILADPNPPSGVNPSDMCAGPAAAWWRTLS